MKVIVIGAVGTTAITIEMLNKHNFNIVGVLGHEPINKKRVSALRDSSFLLWVFYKIFKNIIGYIFIAIGLLALVLPGQGILMILIGLMMSDYPKKFDLEKKIIKINTVRKGVNWIRIKSNVEKIKLN